MTDVAATAASLRPLFWPRSVAVLGASDNPNKIGGIPVRSFREYGYRGAFYPINPTRETVQGLPAFPSLAAVDGPVDVAIMAVPASIALPTAEACAEKGVQALVVFTAGFAEMDARGGQAQQRLAEIGRLSGMRIVGPNCLGYFNPKNGCYGTFSTSFTHGLPKTGNVGMVSQSGAFGAHCFVLGREKGLGFSYWITTGNECDVDVADCIAFMAQDDQTEVIAAYLEGCRDGAKLEQALRLAYEAGKPVVVQKVGRSEVGTAAAAAHTASVTGSDQVYDAVFDRYNVFRCRTVDELIDVVYGCSAGVYPTRGRVCIVTLSGGAGVMMADAAYEVGLDVAPVSEASQSKLKALNPFAAVGNPVDFTAQVYNDMSLITKNYEIILGDEDYDAIVGFFMFLPYSDYLSDEILKALKPVRERFPDRLIVQSIFGPQKNVGRFEEEGYLVIAEPYRALEVVGALVKIGRGFARGLPAAEDPSTAPQLRPGLCDGAEITRLLSDFGLRLIPERLVHSPQAAAAAADQIGFPVAIRIVSPDIPQDHAAVTTTLGDPSPDAARTACERVLDSFRRAHPDAGVEGVRVEYAVPGGVEAVLAVRRDRVFGPVVTLEIGAPSAGLLSAALCRAPFAEVQARRVIECAAGYPRLLRQREGEPAITALARAMARLSVFAEANREVIESVEIKLLLGGVGEFAAVALRARVVTQNASHQ